MSAMYYFVASEVVDKLYRRNDGSVARAQSNDKRNSLTTSPL